MMNILLDQGTPLPLRYSLAGHTIKTVHEQDWGNLTDYELLESAHSAGFDVFITPDRNLSAHHDAARHNMAVVILSKSRWKLIRLVLGDIEAAISTAQRGTYTVIEVPDPPETWDQ